MATREKEKHGGNDDGVIKQNDNSIIIMNSNKSNNKDKDNSNNKEHCSIVRPGRRLSERHHLEINEAFRVFDEEKTGRISLFSLEVLVSALGFRVTRKDILKDVETARRRRQQQQHTRLEQQQQQHTRLEQQQQQQSSQMHNKTTTMTTTSTTTAVEDEDEIPEGLVDIHLVYEILADRYENRSSEMELRTVFQLFDEDDKGYINLEDVQRVALELSQQQRQQQQYGRDIIAIETNDDNDQLYRAMIDEFDRNLDGNIDFDEFQSIFSPPK